MQWRKSWIFAAACAWLLLVGAGMKAAMDYEATPGASNPAPEQWPASSRISPPKAKPRLLVFAHPRCPCTRATFDELLEIAARAPDRAEIDVWFYRPSGAAANWNQGDLWRRVATQPGFKVHNDEEGREARLFGASTSGTVVLFDAQRRLVFRGGLTALRGKAGDSMGRQAVLSFLLDGKPVAAQSPVFGCSLL